MEFFFCLYNFLEFRKFFVFMILKSFRQFTIVVFQPDISGTLAPFFINSSFVLDSTFFTLIFLMQNVWCKKRRKVWVKKCHVKKSKILRIKNTCKNAKICRKNISIYLFGHRFGHRFWFFWNPDSTNYASLYICGVNWYSRRTPLVSTRYGNARQ